jgi:hypothetical protein
MLIAEWDSRKGWGGDGATQSCAHWLNWKCGIDMGAAREKVRTANALVGLPRIAAAMERGELSYAKVRALTRVACENTENTLLEYALHGTAAHVERIVRDFRRCKEAEELSRDAQQQANRKLSWFYDADGMLVIKARLPPETGQMFIKVIEAAREDIPAAEISAETPNVKLPTEPSARKADALAIVAESFLANGAAALKGGDRHKSSSTSTPKRFAIAPPAAATSNTAPAFPQKRPAASLVTAASSPSLRTKTANLSTSAAKPAASLPRFTARLTHATRAAVASLAVRTLAISTAITLNIGLTAAKQNSPTWSASAASIIAKCTKVKSSCSYSTTERFVLSHPPGNPSTARFPITHSR